MLLGGYQIIDFSQLGILSTTEDNPDSIELEFNENSNKKLYDTIISYINVDKICFLTGLKFKRYNSDQTYTVTGALVKHYVEIPHLETNEPFAINSRLNLSCTTSDFPNGVSIDIVFSKNLQDGTSYCSLIITFDFDNI